MEVVYSNEVTKGIDSYANSLNAYPISIERKLQKINNMRNALANIGNAPTIYPICKYKNLGQEFDSGNVPLYKNLRMFTYQDKAKRPWTFSFYICEKAQKVIILRMMYSAFIKEDKFLQKALDLMERLNRI